MRKEISLSMVNRYPEDYVTFTFNERTVSVFIYDAMEKEIIIKNEDFYKVYELFKLTR